MKRAITCILTIALALPFVGCGKETEQPPVSENNDSERGARAIENPVYPEMASYPLEESYINSDGSIDDAYYNAYDAWWNDVSIRRELQADYADNMNAFFAESIRQFLSGAQGENVVYSPLNVYMALGMLSEITDGESREQVLGLLRADNMESLRSQANKIWNANYINDGVTTSIPASSLWLNEDIHFVQSTMDSLAKNYYASSYQGVMGTEEFDHMLQEWLNEQTGGLLDAQTSDISLDDDTVIALAATMNFHAKWSNEFFEENTDEGVFHGAGGDVNCDFMHQNKARNYYWGEKFCAVSQNLQNDGAMWFLLPDEGISADELVQDEQAMRFITSDKSEWEDNQYVTVNLAVPKFDVVSDMDLIPGLKALGVTDVFDPDLSDFTPLTTDLGRICLSQADHAARVKIDEEGCTAVSYTLMSAVGMAMPPAEEVDFVLDRPFIFVITGNGEIPLYVGLVNQPAE